MASLYTPRHSEEVPRRPASTEDKPESRGAANDRTRVQVDSDSDMEDEEYSPDDPEISDPALAAYLERVVSERFGTIQSMVERLPGAAPPIRRSNQGSYSDTPFVEEIASVEMPQKCSFPSIKMYEGIGDPDNHIAQYKQRMLAVAIPRDARKATIDKFVEQFASSRDLEKNLDDLYEILQHRNEPLRSYIARFNQANVATHECNADMAISAFKRGLLPEGDLYKELTKYKCTIMEDVLSRDWAQVRWEEDVASRAKAGPKYDQKPSKPARSDRDKSSYSKSARETSNPNRGMYQHRPLPRSEGMMVSTWPDISHLAITKPEQIGFLRQMGPQVKWPPKMKAAEANRNPKRWCEFHSNHGHTTEDCIALKMEVAELLKKGSSLPIEAAPALPPQQDRVIHVITGGSERILVDNGSSSNIIFYSAFADLGLEPAALTRKATPLVGFSGEVKQTLGEVLLPVYAEGVNEATKFLVVDCPSSYNVILGRPWIHDMGAVPSTLHQLVKFPTPWGIRAVKLPLREDYP
ncbi:uncharacterized protein LOC130500119 [Raphanus sativus]|uniref:Uncharacterized protein LOC130500119 n=1 Tax=Raphanus sativus TaxID=3726 RepID=A0A9W3CH19_RAPSA|nr:uncharacterized protein LOC130500119 [Raphanus sativus]